MSRLDRLVTLPEGWAKVASEGGALAMPYRLALERMARQLNLSGEFGEQLFAAATVLAAQTLLELVPGVNVQPFGEGLATLDGLAPDADNFIVGTGSEWASSAPADARASIGITTSADTNGIAYSAATGIITNTLGTMALATAADYQTAAQAAAAYEAKDATLTAWAGVTFAANKLGYSTGADAFATTDFTSVARTLVAQTTQALMRTAGLGLGDMATQNASAVAITGGTLAAVAISGATTISSGQYIRFTSAGALTIATGAITVTGSRHTVDTEAAAASDDLDTINGGINGQYLMLNTIADARDVVVKNGTGNIRCGADFTLATRFDRIFLVFDAALAVWVCIGKQTN